MFVLVFWYIDINVAFIIIKNYYGYDCFKFAQLSATPEGVQLQDSRAPESSPGGDQAELPQRRVG